MGISGPLQQVIWGSGSAPTLCNWLKIAWVSVKKVLVLTLPKLADCLFRPIPFVCVQSLADFLLTS